MKEQYRVVGIQGIGELKGFCIFNGVLDLFIFCRYRINLFEYIIYFKGVFIYIKKLFLNLKLYMFICQSVIFFDIELFCYSEDL